MLTPLLSSKELFELMRLIQNSRNIVICCHHGPDGDAIGSSLGLQFYLRGLHKKTNIVAPSPYPDFLKWMPENRSITVYSEQKSTAIHLIDSADLIFCLDFNASHRLNAMQEILEKSKAIKVMIDHHENPEEEKFNLVISHPKMSSTSEMIFHIIYQLGAYEKMSRSHAACIYTGMMTDTGAFTYNSNNPETFYIIALLMKRGIDKDEIYKKVYHSWSANRLKLWSYILNNNLTFYANNSACIYTLTREEMKTYKYIRGDAEGLVNEPLKIKGMKLSIALREDTEENIIRVSMRSANGFHCRQLAEEWFNGGGHEDAAGGKLPMPMEEAVKTAEKAIESIDF